MSNFAEILLGGYPPKTAIAIDLCTSSTASLSCAFDFPKVRSAKLSRLRVRPGSQGLTLNLFPPLPSFLPKRTYSIAQVNNYFTSLHLDLYLIYFLGRF